MLEAFENRINRLTAYKTLHGFALGLVSIFIPVFIAQQGFPASVVFTFLLVDVAAFTVVAVPVAPLVSRIGVESSLLASSLLYVLVFIMLQVFKIVHPLIWTVAVLIGLAKAFHWIPVNTEFTVGSEEQDRGESYGKLEGVPKLVSPFAPLIGAAVMAYFGFNLLATLSLVIAIASVLPLLYRGTSEKPDFELEGLLGTGEKDLWTLYFLDGFATTAYVFIFPLFIYYVIGGTLNVGGAKTLMAIGAGLFSIAAGKISDRLEHRDMVLAGAVASAGVYFFVPGLEIRSIAFLLSFVAGLTYTVYTIPLVSIIADIAEQRNVLGFFSVREVFQGFGKISVVGLLLYFLSIGERAAGFRYTFYAAAASVLLLAVNARIVERRR